MEIWKDIIGYEGYYQISNIGRVKSLDRYVDTNDPRPNRLRKLIKSKIVIPNISSMLNSDGHFRGRPGYMKDRKYYRVGLSINGIQKKFPIHRLLYEAFIGIIPDKYVVDHIDNDSLNNSLDNLQAITNRENTIKEIDKSKTASKYLGVYRRHNKWVSTYKRKQLYYGNSEEEAHIAYKNYVEQL